MANPVRFYDAFASDPDYTGRWAITVAPFAFTPEGDTTDLYMEFAVVVPDGVGTNLMVVWLELVDPAEYHHFADGFTFDSAAPPSWLTASGFYGTYDDVMSSYWNTGSGGVLGWIWEWDGTNSTSTQLDAASINPASDPDWWRPPYPAPTISSFTPSTGRVGDAVVITGSGFTPATAVTICGTDAEFTVDSDTQITATVPNGAAGVAGLIVVSVPGGGSDSLAGFTPLYPGPWIQPDDTWTSPGSPLSTIVNAHIESVIDHSGFSPVYVGTTGDSTSDSDSIDYAADLAAGFPPVIPSGGSWPPDAVTTETENPTGPALGPFRATVSAHGGGVEASNLGVHADNGVSDSGADITVSGIVATTLHWTAGPAVPFTVDNDYRGVQFPDPVVLTGTIGGVTTLTVDVDPDLEATLTAGPANPVEQQAETTSEIQVSGEILYRPPRYRFLYPHPLGRPPLAHRQRRDGVATVGPPLAHLQGAVSGQRPDLAHRQQTP